MKRFIITALAVALIATPAWAAVTLTTTADCNVVTLSYSFDGNNVRAFALDITADSGANITEITDLNADYDIYPGSIVIVGGAVTDNGTPVGDSGQYAGTQGGLGTGGITIEMGSLYVGANEPATSGVLCKFGVDADCNVSVAENVIRAGVVMENPDEDPGLVLPDVLSAGPCITDCLIGGNADQGLPAPLDTEYNSWVSLGKPACWCYQRQCRGDINGILSGPFWVNILDLNTFKAAYSKTDAVLATVPGGVCADLNHMKSGPFRVNILDLNILKAYYSKVAAFVPSCDAAPVITGPYDHWETP